MAITDLEMAELVREACYDGGTGPLVLGGALLGYRRFADAVGAGARFPYVIQGVDDPAQWEAGVGTLDGDGRLVREPAASSAGGAAVDFAVGEKRAGLALNAGWIAAVEAHGHGLDAIDGLAEALAGKQAASAELGALAGMAATDFGRALLEQGDGAAAREHIGAGTVTRVEAAGGTTGLSFGGGPVTGAGTLTLGGVLAAGHGGTGAAALTGYIKGNGTAAMTASATIPRMDISGLGTAAVKNIGTSGDAVPLLNAANLWSIGQNFSGGITASGAIVADNYIGASAVEIGQSRTSDGDAYVDFHGAAGSDFDARIWRESGANGNFRFMQSGTGSVTFGSATANHLVIASSGAVSLAIPLPVSSGGTGAATAAAARTNLGLASGTYMPAISLMFGVGSVTPYSCQYMRVGDVVTVSGKLDIDPSEIGSVIFRMSLPVGSAFTATEQAGGTASTGYGAATMAAAIVAAAPGLVQFELEATDAGKRTFWFSFTYRIV